MEHPLLEAGGWEGVVKSDVCKEQDIPQLNIEHHSSSEFRSLDRLLDCLLLFLPAVFVTPSSFQLSETPSH